MTDSGRNTNQNDRPGERQGIARAGYRDPDIVAFASRNQKLSRRAEMKYAPIVEGMIGSSNRDVRQIEQTLDGLLDYCGHCPVLTLYPRLCRYYWDIDPAAAARYVQFYREMWGSEAPPDRSNLND